MENTEIMSINEGMENEAIVTEETSVEKEPIGGAIAVLALAAVGGVTIIKKGIDIGKKVGPKIGAKVKGVFKKKDKTVEAEATEVEVEESEE